jgi:GNAT superfamily N-acetyltransferase
MTEDEGIVGFTIVFEDLLYLMMVDESRHRAGLGSQLLQYAERQLFAENDVIRLNTFDGNEQAVHFYLKNGWQETHREEDSDHGFVRRFFEKHSDQA